MSLYAKHADTKFKVGDTVQVHYKLIEKEKVAGRAKREVKEEIRERIQVFEGVVIAISGSRENRMFTVRRIGSAGIGIERIFPLSSPWIKKITVKRHGDPKRAKLYYLRKKIASEAEKLALKHEENKIKEKEGSKNQEKEKSKAKKVEPKDEK